MPDEVSGAPSAVTALRAELEEAEKQFSSAADARGQRAAVIRSLRAVSTLLGSIGVRTSALLVIEDAFRQLDHGVVVPVVTKVILSGRAPPGILRGCLQGHALGVVQAMTEYGEPLQEARRKVARVLNQAGVRPLRGSGKITERTIRTWASAASTDKRSAAAAYLRRFPSDGGRGASIEMKNSLLRGLSNLAQGYAGKAT